MATVQEEIKQYQWIKGDNFGLIVDVLSEDSEFTNFTDGTKIFKTIQSEFLEQVIGGVIPLPGALGVADLATGDPILKPKAISTVAPVKQNEPTVLGKMILKMSKKNVVNVPIQINLNIPTPQLYSMLGEGMESDDLNEEIMEVALSQIEMDKLQDYIKSNITTFLSEYYS